MGRSRIILLIVLVGVVALTAAGGLTLTHFDRKWIQDKADDAEDAANTYTQSYMSSTPMMLGGADASDTFTLFSADSTDTTMMFWDDDTFWIQSTGPVNIDSLLGYLTYAILNDSLGPRDERLDSLEAHQDTIYALIDSLEALADTLDVPRQVVWVDYYPDQDTIDKYCPGWLLCDGTSGTPPLLNRFIVGAGDTYALSDSGGVDSTIYSVEDHRHGIGSDGAHTHGISGISDTALGQRYVSGTPFIAVEVTGVPTIDSDGAHDHSGATRDTTATTDYQDNRPPFYALTPIMRKP